jgi:signal transduction histidine kinase
MSLLEIVQLIGYSTGAILHLWIGWLLSKKQGRLDVKKRLLLILAVTVGVWHGSNLIVTLHGLLLSDYSRWTNLLRFADTTAIISITLTYSLLLHVHLHLWADVRSRPLTRFESWRVILSYLPLVFLLVAIPHVWTEPYARMFDKMAYVSSPLGSLNLLLPFAIWAFYVLCLVAITDLLISRWSSTNEERQLMRALAISFLAVGSMVLIVVGFRVGDGHIVSRYLETITNLGSILPSALIAYYVYRYRYLELIIQRSLVIASFAVVVLIFYLYGVLTLGQFLTDRYGLRRGAIESLMILLLASLAMPLRLRLEMSFRRLFKRETGLYGEIVSLIAEKRGDYKQLPLLLRSIEKRIETSLGLRSIKIVELQKERIEEISKDNEIDLDWIKQILELLHANHYRPLVHNEGLKEDGFNLIYSLHRETVFVGLMFVKADNEILTDDIKGMLEILSYQLAIAIEDCMLVEKNVQLERRLADGERLAALGQMAATVAHEIKNPLSAIKSIVQVMGEDDQLRRAYGRDVELIVKEVDRLSRSVTQLLGFARKPPEALSRGRLNETIKSVIDLFQIEASQREVELRCMLDADIEMDGSSLVALRDSLSNLILNGIQAVPKGGIVSIESSAVGDEILISIVDSGSGIAEEFCNRIWEPFFTTKQRGTGLGLAIVKKRIEEIGGTVNLVAQREDEGARFELRIPIINGESFNEPNSR